MEVSSEKGLSMERTLKHIGTVFQNLPAAIDDLSPAERIEIIYQFGKILAPFSARMRKLLSASMYNGNSHKSVYSLEKEEKQDAKQYRIEDGQC